MKQRSVLDVCSLNSLLLRGKVSKDLAKRSSARIRERERRREEQAERVEGWLAGVLSEERWKMAKKPTLGGIYGLDLQALAPGEFRQTRRSGA